MAIDLFRCAETLLTDHLSQHWVFVRMNHAEALRRKFEVEGDEKDLLDAKAIFDDDITNIGLTPADTLECIIIRLRVIHALWRLHPNIDGLKALQKDYAELGTIMTRSTIARRWFPCTTRRC